MLFFLLLFLLGGGNFLSPHVQFFRVCKDKNFVSKGVGKGKIFVLICCEEAKNLSQTGWERENNIVSKGVGTGKRKNFVS